MAYNVGDQVKLEARFLDSANALADPSTVTVKVKTPSGVTTTYTSGQISRDSVGIYSKVIDLPESGMWTFQWSSTGLVGVEEGLIFVRANVIV